MKDLPTWSDLNKGVRKMTDKEFEYCEEMEKRKHDEKLKELREVQLLSQHILDLQKDKGKLTDRVRELEQQIEKMKKYGKLLQDICVAMGNDPYMVWRGIEQRVLILWNKSEEAEGLKLANNILDRLLEIKPQDWAEIEKWEIKENENN